MTVIPPEVRSELDQLERRHAENRDGRYFVPLANAYRKAGKTARAVSVLRQGLAKHPDYVSARIVLAHCMRDEGNLSGATAEYDHVLSLDSQNLVALRSLGDMAAAAGEVDDATRWYDRLLAVDPMNEEARAGLEALSPSSTSVADEEETGGLDGGAAPTTAATGFVPDTAMEDALESIAAGSDAADDVPTYAGETVVTETIAELYTKQGLFDRATGIYRELIRRRGEDPHLRDQLSRVERLAAGESLESPLDLPPFLDAVEARSGIDLPSPSPGDADTADSADLVVAAGDQDPFADSFAKGFPDRSIQEQAAETTAEADSDFSEAGDRRPPITIREYLREVLDWRPGGATSEFTAVGVHDSGVEDAADAPASSADVAPVESGALPDWLSTQEMSTAAPAFELEDRDDSDDRAPESLPEWPADDRESASSWEFDDVGIAADTNVADAEPFRTVDSSAGPTASLPDDELFPWELPPDLDEDTSAPAPSMEAEETPESDALFAFDRVEVQPSADADDPVDGNLPSASSEQAPVTETVSPESGADEGEDDDLESFQAWLRSLKR